MYFKSRKKILYLFVAFVLIFIFLLFFLINRLSPVRLQADYIWNQIRKGEIKQVYQNSLFYQKNIPFDTFRNRLGSGTEYDIVYAKKIKRLGEGKKDKLYYVDGEFIFKNGIKQIIVFRFKKQENGKFILEGITLKDSSND